MLDLTVNEKRPRWLGNILCMDDSRLPKEAVYQEVKASSFSVTIQQDLYQISLNWK